MATVEEAVGALKHLESKFGSSPSVAEVAAEMGVSSATAFKYLKQAAKDGTIAQRDRKFMTLEVARAFEKGK